MPRQHVLGLLLALLGVTVCSAQVSGTASLATFLLSHEEAEKKAEEDAIRLLERLDALTSKQEASSFISAAFERGWFTFARRLISLSSSSGLDVQHIVHASRSTLLGKLNQVVEHAATAASSAAAAAAASGAAPDGDGAGKSTQPAVTPATPSPIPTGISPAFEWAQSHELVSFNVKFSHKWDTPATLGCEAGSQDFSVNNRSFIFKADCKTARKTFVLSLTLHDELDPEASSFSLTSVGRATITLKKTRQAVWPRLFGGASRGGGSKNQHVWWAMREKFDKDIEAWEKKLKEDKERADKERKEAQEQAANAAANADAAAEQAASGDVQVPIDANGDAGSPAAATEDSAAPTSASS